MVERLGRRAAWSRWARPIMDEFAMGSSNENSHFGAVKNPWDASRVPGGSSGGSAAAVAAGLAPAATGTDTGGSIRQPASFSGITGIKPTYGRVSRCGMIAFASSLDQGGPMAHTAEDCAMLLGAMAGFDERDSTSLAPAQGGVDEDYTRLLGKPRAGASVEKPLSGLRIGLPTEYFGKGLSADVEQAVRAALAEYEKLGATLVEVSLPKTELSIPVYYVIAPAEASSNLSRFRRRALRPSRRRVPRPDGHVQEDPRRRLRPRRSSAASWWAPMCCRMATTTPTTCRR
ncbi:amidase [Cupriavidus basilensis]